MKINLALILLIVGVLIVGYYFVGGVNGLGDIFGTNPVKEINCEVTLLNPIGIPGIQNGDPKFNPQIPIKCSAISIDRCSLFSVGTLSIVDNVNLRMSAGGKSLSESFGVYESGLGVTTKKLSLCVGEEVHSVTFQLFNEKGGLLDIQEKSI